jgi:hypothetical protein
VNPTDRPAGPGSWIQANRLIRKRGLARPRFRFLLTVTGKGLETLGDRDSPLIA